MKPTNNQKSKFITYLKKLGVVGFAFFFLKGLVWIAIFMFGMKGCQWLS